MSEDKPFRIPTWLCGSRETRTHKRLAPPPVFKTGSSSGRMTSVTSCGGWNRTNGLLVQRQASLPTATTPHRSCSMTRVTSDGSLKAAGAGIEPADPWFKATDFYQQKLPRNRNRKVGSTAPQLHLFPLLLTPSPFLLPPSKVPCGSRTRLTGLEDRGLCRSAKSTFLCERRGSRTRQGADRARPDHGFAAAAAIASRLALPSSTNHVKLRRQESNLRRDG